MALWVDRTALARFIGHSGGYPYIPTSSDPIETPGYSLAMTIISADHHPLPRENSCIYINYILDKLGAVSGKLKVRDEQQNFEKPGPREAATKNATGLFFAIHFQLTQACTY